MESVTRDRIQDETVVVSLDYDALVEFMNHSVLPSGAPGDVMVSKLA